MARRGRAAAERETEQAAVAQLGYLARNPQFCKSVDVLAELRDALPGTSSVLTLERVEALEGLQAKLQEAGAEWGIPWDLLSLLSFRQWRRDQDPSERIPSASFLSDSPVVAWPDSFTLPEPFVSVLRADGRESVPEPTRYLNLRVDLDHPVEALLPLIEKELGRHSPRHRRGRRRLNQVEFHLKVFDLAEEGMTFKAMAVKLGRRPSTIKSALLVARRKIFGDAPIPSKAALPLLDFDPATHVPRCSTCQNALALEEMCGKARAYGRQDHRGQRELTGLETDRVMDG